MRKWSQEIKNLWKKTVKNLDAIRNFRAELETFIESEGYEFGTMFSASGYEQKSPKTINNTQHPTIRGWVLIQIPERRKGQNNVSIHRNCSIILPYC